MVSVAVVISCFGNNCFVDEYVSDEFKVQGGGPYGQEVTRGQDLTGKDFSGKTLIKQDFKTVHFLFFIKKNRVNLIELFVVLKRRLISHPLSVAVYIETGQF